MNPGTLSRFSPKKMLRVSLFGIEGKCPSAAGRQGGEIGQARMGIAGMPVGLGIFRIDSGKGLKPGNGRMRIARSKKNQACRGHPIEDPRPFAVALEGFAGCRPRKNAGLKFVSCTMLFPRIPESILEIKPDSINIILTGC